MPSRSPKSSKALTSEYFPPRTCLRAVSGFLLSPFVQHYRMSQTPSPSPGSFSKPSTTTESISNFNVIFEKALEAYRKKTRQRLTTHPLATQLDKCDSPAGILAIVQDQVDQFNQFRSGDERLRRWLGPTINVLLAFTDVLGESISLVNIP